MNFKQGCDKLLARGWLSEASADFSSALLAIGTWHSYPAGHALSLAGTQNGGMKGIVAGWVNCTTSLGPVDGGLIHIAGQGDWFGETPLISRKSRTLSCIARTSTDVVEIRSSAVQRLLADQPMFWKAIAELALINSRVSANIAADLGIRDSRRRCIASLLRLAGCRFGNLAPGMQIAPVTQDELASVANMSRSTAGHVLARLSHMGLVEARYGQIQLLDPDGLRTIIDE